MNCSDLQIGDWVMYNSKPIQVTSLYGKPTEYGEFVSNEIGWSYSPNTWVDGDFIEPIPLTDIILKKNGFELRDNHYIHRIDDKPHHYDFKLKVGGVFASEGYTLECGIYRLTIRYVHELQHLLRLCGLNELADNFKVEEVK